MAFLIGSTPVIDNNAKVPWAQIGGAPSGIIKNVTTRTIGNGTNPAAPSTITFNTGTGLLSFTFSTDC